MTYATKVYDLRTMKAKTYAHPPKIAVLLAYSESVGDGDAHRAYERYGDRLESDSFRIMCGDYAVLKHRY